jgi:SAM-dependent methyltransferase
MEGEETRRVQEIYGRYRRSARRRRAWAADNPGNRTIREELLQAVLDAAGPELATGGEVLDVGCGTGFWLAALTDRGIDPDRLVGVDVLPERVSAARSRAPGASVHEADARSLPFDDGRFAAVLLFTVLSSLASAADVRLALAEARRVLWPGGLLLCYESRLANPLNRRVRGVRGEDLDAAGIAPRVERRLTLFPPLARRLGGRTDALYARLARLAPLRTHRLVTYRKDEPL